MDKRFEHAISKVLALEGGYVNDPKDLGGETKYGISKRSYPNVDIKSLTREQAIEIYRRDWWDRYNYDSIQDLDVATKVFDISVNTGPDPAHRILQRAINLVSDAELKVDGALGPLTMGAANQTDPDKLLEAIQLHAAKYYHALAKARVANRTFLLGWLNRAFS